MSGRFVEDPNFRDALLRSAGVKEMLEERVGAAADLAAELAPDDPATTDNDLHTSVFGDVDLTQYGWAGRVGALNFKAGWFEEGAQGVPARPFLRPAVEAEIGPVEAGDDVDLGDETRRRRALRGRARGF